MTVARCGNSSTMALRSMLCVDVNVLIDANNGESAAHGAVTRWLDRALTSVEPLAVPLFVATGFLRVITDRRIFPVAATEHAATAFTDWLLSHSNVVVPPTSHRQYAITRDLMLRYGLRGQDVPDAMLAATAIEIGATLVTGNRGFKRFPELTVVNPTEPGE